MARGDETRPYGVASFYAPTMGAPGAAASSVEPVMHGPSRFTTYADQGYFRHLRPLLDGETPAVAILRRIFASGLRGCGGSHVPLIKKWEAAIPHRPRYLVVNALEGEPDTFKDRFLLARHPRIVLEGIAIACRVLGIREVKLVINAAYTEGRTALEETLAREEALLDGLAVELLDGPEEELYVVGEETALLNYLEGGRGEPRLKPPFPHERGLWGAPTLIHNVETLSWIPILLDAPERFAQRHPKLLTVSGDVALPGIHEVTLGISLTEILRRAGAEDVAFVEIGGIAGGVLPAAALEVAYEDGALAPLGVQVGSGTLRVFDSRRDPLAETVAALEYFSRESCGRCTPCRVGTGELARFARELREAPPTTAALHRALHRARHIAETLRLTSTCGLGRAAPLPLLSYLKHFTEHSDG